MLWGTAFALIKIAVEGGFGPSGLVMLRVVVAAVLLGGAALALRRPWPRRQRGRFWLFCVILAVSGTCLPFFLITLAQQRIDSGLTGILMAIMPLATIVLAHFFAGEPLSRGKLVGCLIGFTGIVMLIGPAALTELGGSGDELWYQLAALAAALSYAANAVITRRRPPADALPASAGVMLAACLLMLPFGAAPLPGELAAAPAPALTAALLLAVLCTALATVLFFRLIALAGPSFMSFINYLIPLWALLVGVLFLGEPLRWNALAALALILAGIGVSETFGRRR